MGAMHIAPSRQLLFSHPRNLQLLTLILAAVDYAKDLPGSYVPFGRTLRPNGSTSAIPLNPNTPLKYADYFRQELDRMEQPGICCIWEEEGGDGLEQNVLRVEFYFEGWLSFCGYIPENNQEAWWIAEPVAH